MWGVTENTASLTIGPKAEVQECDRPNEVFFPSFLSKKNFFNVYLFLRVTERARAGEGQREGDTESEADSSLRAVSTEPNTGLELMNCKIMI